MKKIQTQKQLEQRNRRITFMLSLMLSLVCVSQNVLAADVITGGFTTLTDLVKSFVSSIGTIIVMWGLFEWGNSMQSNDGMMQSAAFKRIGGGIVMTLGPELLKSFT